ncbi:hypothetical protein V6N11_047801 [Hibiscus sabdariffa]|uniref:Uncharacterized protein n=1 Tax=Hibiscus sabdariffa TaxID=183260 RepID=A0ABR2P807_9ROSI
MDGQHSKPLGKVPKYASGFTSLLEHAFAQAMMPTQSLPMKSGEISSPRASLLPLQLLPSRVLVNTSRQGLALMLWAAWQS